jgi:hypothetical protein
MADYYTLLTDAGIAYETACKAAGVPIKLSQISVGDGGGAVYNPAATATALKREVWRGPLNALFQDENNPSWLLAEVTIPPEVGGWYVREAGLWTDTGILYAIVKYPESFKPVLATSGSGKEFYIRSIFETSNAALVTLLIDDTVVKATRAWVTSYVADELARLDRKQSVRVATTANIVLSGAQTIDGVAVVAGDRVLVKSQTLAKDNGIYVAASGSWLRAKDADVSVDVTSALTVSIEQGATLADTIWQLITDGAIVLGTTALAFQNVTQGFASLNSPALINPTANTPPLFDNTLKVATTEFVERAKGNYRGFLSITAPTTLVAATAFGSMVSLIGTFTITLPAANSGSSGGTINFRNIGSDPITVACAGADTINTGAGIQVTLVMPVGSTLELATNGAGAWWASGSAQLASSQVLAQPIGTTAPLFDATQKFATTEFVKKNSGNHAAIGSLNANIILTGANTFGMSYMLNSVTPFTVTLPLGSTAGNGGVVTFTNVSTAPVTLALQGTDYMTGIAGVGAGGSVVLRQRDTITLSCAGGTTWYAEDGSVRDAQSTAIRSLMGNYSGVKILSVATALTVDDTGVICIGSFGLAGLDITLPQLSTTTSGQSIVISAGAGAFNLKPFAGDPGISIGLSVLSIVHIDVFESIILVSNPTGWRVVSGTVLNKYSGMFSFTTSGYQKLPSGMIIQWVNGSVPAGAGTAHLTLPITFPTNLLAYSFGTSLAATWVTGSTASTTGIDIVARGISSGAVVAPAGIVGYTFMCVGY